jgi:prepilin-type N-terminal cleavage/methylation domain-containing protein
MRKQNGFTLVEIVIVVAIIGVLAAVSVVIFKPQEIFANGRNSKRLQDVGALNQAVGQWLSREGTSVSDPYTTLGLIGGEILALTPNDGSIREPNEGVDATTVSEISLPAYIHLIPTDPLGGIEYRIGVDDTDNPLHVLVCTDQIEFTESYQESKYPNGIYCQSN